MGRNPGFDGSRGPAAWAAVVCWDGLRRVAVVAALALVSAVVIDAPSSAQDAVPYPDVAADAYYSVPVAALADDGVFAGTECDDGFCPGEPIDRATMAVWTVRVLDGLEPVAVGSTRFDDVDASHPHAAFIERLAELGVTTGCRDGTIYCPDDPVTRAQMAVFLSRAYKLAEGPDPDFSDVSAGAWYASDVARLAASGITKGCGDGTRFCPGRPTTRAQMATFLHRADTRTPPSHGGGLFNAVSAGELHTCGLRASGAVECWGYSDLGRVDALQGPFSAVSAGGLHTCALRTDSAVECWGNDDDGQTDAPAGSFSAVSAGQWHSCALLTDGTIECWGYNDLGQTDAPAGTFNAVSAGGLHTCGLHTSGTIECWGNDDNAEDGDG